MYHIINSTALLRLPVIHEMVMQILYDTMKEFNVD